MADAIMIATASMKNPARIANAILFFSSISFLILLRGVSHSISANVTKSIAIPIAEKIMEFKM